MAVTAVVGAQWGDEGKGRIVDYLAQRAQVVIRFQGGDNAGHTVVNKFGKFQLHVIPCGIFFPETKCIVGTGTVVNPDGLLAEMELLKQAGVSLDNLWLSERAHITLPVHRLIEEAEETARKGDQIGTTKRGIGPSYSDKAARDGLRLGDLLRPEYLKGRAKRLIERKNRLLSTYDRPPIDEEEFFGTLERWTAQIGPRIINTMPMIRDAVKAGESVLLEGQLGVMRDLDWGIYPYATSSNPTAGHACTGAGMPPSAVKNVLGVVKTYSTCVGAGPFPVELEDEFGERLRTVGDEYGATTRRPRRCGWYDALAVSHAVWLNGFTSLAVTKLDVLDGIDELKICTAYKLDGELIQDLPHTPDLDRVECVYESWPGWKQTTRTVRSWNDLPEEAKNYLNRIAELAGVPIGYVSVGPARDQLMVLKDINAEA